MNDDLLNIILYFVLIICIYALFIFNPFSILTYLYIPILFLSIFIIIYYAFYLNDNANFHIEFFYNFIKILGLFLVTFILFYIFKFLIKYFSLKSFGLLFAFYIIIFSIIYQLNSTSISFQFNKLNNIKNLIKYFIFYLPCILIDIIKYLLQDYKNTNKTTIILFCLLILCILVFIIYPYFNSFNDNGILLINGKHYLNEDIIKYTLKDLNDLIIKNRKVWYTYTEGYKSLNSSETNDMTNTVKNNYNKTKNYIEDNLTTNSETIQHLMNKYRDEPEKMDKYVKDKINNSIYLKMQYYIELIKQKLFLNGTIPSGFNLDSDMEYTYHFGISFWLYLDTNMLNNNDDIVSLIISIGSRPSLYFDQSTRELYVEILDYNSDLKNVKQKRRFKTNELLYQKWNHVVMNYVNGQFDLFINNILVHTQKNVSPYINKNDILKIGSSDNSDMGGISNMIYYEQPLQLSKIKQLFNQKKIVPYTIK